MQREEGRVWLRQGDKGHVDGAGLAWRESGREMDAGSVQGAEDSSGQLICSFC